MLYREGPAFPAHGAESFAVHCGKCKDIPGKQYRDLKVVFQHLLLTNFIVKTTYEVCELWGDGNTKIAFNFLLSFCYLASGLLGSSRGLVARSPSPLAAPCPSRGLPQVAGAGGTHISGFMGVLPADFCYLRPTKTVVAGLSKTSKRLLNVQETWCCKWRMVLTAVLFCPVIDDDWPLCMLSLICFLFAPL